MEKEYTVTVTIINGNTRYIIVDENSGEILDDCQGYGYKTKQSAHKGYWYIIRGKSIKKKNDDKFEKYKKENTEVINEIESWIESIWKGLACGDYDMDFIFKRVEEKFNIRLADFIKRKYERK